MKPGVVFIILPATFQLAYTFGYLQNLGADESSVEARLDALELRFETVDALELRLDALVNGVDISSPDDCYKLGTVGDMTCPGMSDILTTVPMCTCANGQGNMYCNNYGSCMEHQDTTNNFYYDGSQSETLCFPEIKDKDSCETWFASVAEAQATWNEDCLVGSPTWAYQFSDMSQPPSGKCYGHVYVPSDPNPSAAPTISVVPTSSHAPTYSACPDGQWRRDDGTPNCYASCNSGGGNNLGPCGDGTSSGCCNDENHPQAADRYNGQRNCYCDPDATFVPTPLPSYRPTYEDPEACPATCFGQTCDNWVSQYTCDYLEGDYGCDCTGCSRCA